MCHIYLPSRCYRCFGRGRPSTRFRVTAVASWVTACVSCCRRGATAILLPLTATARAEDGLPCVPLGVTAPVMLRSPAAIYLHLCTFRSLILDQQLSELAAAVTVVYSYMLK